MEFDHDVVMLHSMIVYNLLVSANTSRTLADIFKQNLSCGVFTSFCRMADDDRLNKGREKVYYR